MEVITTKLLALIIASVIVESVAFVIIDIKMIKDYDEKITQVNFKNWIAIALGIAICFAANIDALHIFLGTVSVGWRRVIGTVISGLIISRGSNFIHDILKKIKGSGTSKV